MNLSIECLEAAQVDLLLQGNLIPHEYAAAQEHLEVCEQCRRRVEETIGPEQWWEDVASSLNHVAASLRDADQLGAQGWDDDGASLGDRGLGDASLGETRLRETRLRAKLLDLLGPTDDPNMLGRIGPYEITGLLGQGGMGAVFKGFDRSLNRFVAIKMLLPHLAASGAARKRFAREGQAVAAVVDDHVMAIHCVDEWQGVPYLVMTYSRGVSLQKRLSDNGPLEVREILRIGMQAAKGLAAAHAQGIVHRDIKPANIFLDQSVERVQLMDFGLARAVDDASLTRSGTLAGTPQYMSPEQARAETVDHRSDLFSLGSVMYAMCTGHAPFRAESSYSILRLITDKEPRPIREINPEIPEWLCLIINKLMAKQASARIGFAKEVAALLEDCLAHVQQPTTTHLPESIANVSAKLTRRPPVGKLIALAAFACSLVFVGVFIVLELNKGTLTIESEANDIPIRITQNNEIVDKLSVSTSGKSIRVSAGRYLVEIDGDIEGIEVVSNQVELKRSGKATVRIVKQDSIANQELANYDIVSRTRLKEYRRFEVDGKIVVEAPGEAQWDQVYRGLQGLLDPRLGTSVDPLVFTVDRFNEEMQRKFPSHVQPPLTKDELIACASWNELGDDHSAAVSGVLAAIANRHQLLDGWAIHGDYVELPPEDTPVRAFRIVLQHSQSGERFIVRERFVAPLKNLSDTKAQRDETAGISLSAAIKRLNASHFRADGKKQPPLTEAEVIAAITHQQTRRDEYDVSDALFERLQDIARTRYLPEGATLEVIPTFGTEGGSIYTIWSVRVKLVQDEAGKEGWTYAFIIREQFVSVKHGDAGEIHWGTPGANGLQAGVRLSPPLLDYSIGQKIEVELFYRNVLTKPVPATLMNFPSYEVEGQDESGMKLRVLAPAMKIVGGGRLEQIGEQTVSLKGKPLVIAPSSLGPDETARMLAEQDGAVLIFVEAGSSYRLQFTVENSTSDASNPIQTGEIQFSVSHAVESMTSDRAEEKKSQRSIQDVEAEHLLLKQLQGEWEITKIIDEYSDALSSFQDRSATITVTGNLLVVGGMRANAPKIFAEIPMEFRFKEANSGLRQAVDVLFEPNDTERPCELPGIIEVDDDRLRFCLRSDCGATDDQRPRQFTGGKFIWLYEAKRRTTPSK